MGMPLPKRNQDGKKMKIELNKYSELKEYQQKGIDDILADVEREFKITISYDLPDNRTIKAEGIVFFHSMFMEWLYDQSETKLERPFDKLYYEFLEDYIKDLKWEPESDHRREQLNKRFTMDEYEERKKEARRF
jgi:hypothetical protein